MKRRTVYSVTISYKHSKFHRLLPDKVYNDCALKRCLL